MSRDKRSDTDGRVVTSGRPKREGDVRATDPKQARARQTDGAGAEKPGDIPKEGWKAILTRVQMEIKNDNVSLLASGVAFRALLALFPALIAAVSIWGLVASEETVTQQITDFTGQLPDDAASLIETQLTEVATGGGGQLGLALLISLAIALWSASSGVLGLIDGCSAAYDEADERSFPARRGLAFLLTLGAIVFLLIAIGLIAVLPAVLDQFGLGETGELAIRIGQWPLLAFIAFLAIAVVYRVGPDRATPQTKWVTWGAAIATLLWLIGSGLFTIYVENFGDYGATYGAIAGVIILMLWLFLTAFCILLGAEINAEMERQTGVDSTTGEPKPIGSRDADPADHTPSEYGRERR
jgi:membrane protein